MTVAGIHTLDNFRLVRGDEVLLYADPESVVIEVIDRLLVTQVTARALTAAEIREKGLVFDSSSLIDVRYSYWQLKSKTLGSISVVKISG